jgi:tetratricopeptide (TPR) repeat protein
MCAAFNTAVLAPPRRQVEVARTEMLCRVARSSWRRGDIDSAISDYQQVLQADDQSLEAHDSLAQLHMQRRELDEALDHSAQALELAPHRLDVALTRASVLVAARDAQAAWPIIRGLIAMGHTPVRLVVLFSRIAPQVKAEAGASSLILRLLSERRFNNHSDERGLRYAAATLLDRAGRFDDAFEQARLGGILRGVHYNAAATQASVDRQIQYFTRERLACLPRATHQSETPLFIVGMPRSGTSLVEQILASHPQVEGGGELDLMFKIATAAMQKLSRQGWAEFPQYFNRLSLGVADELADIYLRPLVALNPAARRITDKMPLNFLQVGLIALLFPQARVIHCRRDPLDTCLSCFMTDFASGNEFSYDLAALGHFHRQQERLMAHWKSVVDLPILDVSYEQLVSEAEPQTRRLLDFAGLSWNDKCLRFHENDRFVNTASNEQVRRPMYKSSVQRWKNYEKHLAPLRQALIQT